MEYGASKELKLKMGQFNLRFMLAIDCYMPSVARSLMKDCREDIRLFGFEYAQKKWSKFVYCSLTGKGIKPGLDLDFEAFCEVLEGESKAEADG